MTFFDFNWEDMASTSEVIADLLNDCKPLIIVMVALMIGFYILGSLIKIFTIKRMDRN